MGSVHMGTEVGPGIRGEHNIISVITVRCRPAPGPRDRTLCRLGLRRSKFG
jgi:hypothetical protein